MKSKSHQPERQGGEATRERDSQGPAGFDEHSFKVAHHHHAHKARKRMGTLLLAIALQAPHAKNPASRKPMTQITMLAQQATAVMDWRWKDGKGQSIHFDDLVQQIQASQTRRKPPEVHVGADSAIYGDDRVIFSIAVCLYSVGNAGRYFYTRIEKQRNQFPVLQTRLLKEVELALDAAQELTSLGIGINRVHCDSNVDPSCKSSEHTPMLTGYIKAMGFDYYVKPNAWANLVADRHSRGSRRMAR